jgi:large subunit ribosomal protein L7/L12
MRLPLALLAALVLASCGDSGDSDRSSSTTGSARPALGSSGTAESARPAGEDERTAFDVILLRAGRNQINVIRVVREVTALGLAEARELVGQTPTAIKESVSREEADAIATKLRDAGADVEVR